MADFFAFRDRKVLIVFLLIFLLFVLRRIKAQMLIPWLGLSFFSPGESGFQGVAASDLPHCARG